MRVLIVQGDALVAATMEAMARNAGLEAASTSDAASALAMADRWRPGAALVGMWLRDGLTGGAVAVALRERGVVPIVVTADPDLVAAEARAACLAVLAKPAEPSLLLALLRETAHRRP